MKKLAAVAVFLFFTGFVLAQSEQRTETTTTTTTWNGTLFDEGCRTTHTQQKETTSNENGNRTETKTTVTTDCPVTMTTTSFGLMTPEGKYVHFDDAGNTRIVESVKKNKIWTSSITEHRPIKTSIVGTRNGDVVVIKEIR